MNKNEQNRYYLDYISFMCVGIFSLGYIIFVRPFAEMHVQFPFLSFPLFLGEILFFICLCSILKKNGMRPQKLGKIEIVIVLFILFVLGKALYGYYYWGALAFRHAALFYYPAFIIFAYSFYRRDFFTEKMSILFLIIIFILLISRKFGCYWTFTLCCMSIILISSFSNKKVKLLMFGLLLISTPYKVFFETSRMMMVANSVVGIYLAISFYLILKVKNAVKVGIVILGIVLLVGGFMKFADKNALMSIIKVGKIIEVFKAYDRQIEPNLKAQEERKKEIELGLLTDEMRNEASLERKKSLLKENDIRLYRPEIIDLSILDDEYTKGIDNQMDDLGQENANILSSNEKQKKINQKLVKRNRRSENIRVYWPENEQTFKPENIKLYYPEALAGVDKLGDPGKISEKKAEEIIKAPRSINVAYINAVFRLFIWRDMLVELNEEKPILGFDFGKPLRPKSLIAIGWGAVDRRVVGWVAPHNSYLHIIYRTGVVGLLSIILFFIFFFKLIIGFIRLKSMPGILLCGALINWFVAANFLLILELPYTAVPIWSILGLTLAYYRDLRQGENNSIRTDIK